MQVKVTVLIINLDRHYIWMYLHVGRWCFYKIRSHNIVHGTTIIQLVLIFYNL